MTKLYMYLYSLIKCVITKTMLDTATVRVILILFIVFICFFTAHQPNDPKYLEVLKKYFGYSNFRPYVY